MGHKCEFLRFTMTIFFFFQGDYTFKREIFLGGHLIYAFVPVHSHAFTIVLNIDRDKST